jgi:hypothetical protein
MIVDFERAEICMSSPLQPIDANQGSRKTKRLDVTLPIDDDDKFRRESGVVIQCLGRLSRSH